MKRPELLLEVARGLVACSGHRQIARSLRCAPSTVTRIAARLGRHCLLLQTTLLELLRELETSESVVLDHFVGFTGSQQDRLGIATPIGARSRFDYGPEPAVSRGQPRGSPRKPALRRPLPDVESRAVERSVRHVLDRLIPRGVALDLVTDDHPAYPRAIAAHPARARIRHRAYPNPKRRTTPEERAVARERDRAMWPVDMVHQLTRHTLSHHRRETIAFGRRSNALMERAFVFAIWRNLVKRRSERIPDDRTPAVMLGLAPRRFRWGEVFARRLFPDRVRPSRSWLRIYRRGMITPAAGRNTTHALRFAY